MPPRFGVQLPTSESFGIMTAEPEERCETVFQMAQKAEELEFDSVWVADHISAREGESGVPSGIESSDGNNAFWFECWSMMAGLARETRRVQLGQMATAIPFREPTMLAKIVATVDHMCRGRLIVGVGAGYIESEHTPYGFKWYPKASQRIYRMREAVEVMRAMWAEDSPTFRGEYYAIEDAVNWPKPWQRPGPPVWITGGGEKLTLRAVAELGDGCNVFGGPDTVARKLEILRGHCDAVGRDYNSITKSAMANLTITDGAAQVPRRYGSFAGTRTEVIDRIVGLVEAGVEHLIIGLYKEAVTEQGFERLAGIVQDVRERVGSSQGPAR